MKCVKKKWNENIKKLTVIILLLLLIYARTVARVGHQCIEQSMSWLKHHTEVECLRKARRRHRLFRGRLVLSYCAIWLTITHAKGIIAGAGSWHSRSCRAARLCYYYSFWQNNSSSFSAVRRGSVPCIPGYIFGSWCSSQSRALRGLL